MRYRFFLVILTVLGLVTIASLVIHTRFLKKSRLELIDQQVRETAEALIDSKLGDLRAIDFAESEKIIGDELGDSKIGKIFIIRREDGDEIFENELARQVGSRIRIPVRPQWVTFHTKGQYIRILNLTIPKFPDRTLTVGLVVPDDYTGGNYFSKSKIEFVAMILAIGFVASLFLTSYLLNPLVKLERFLTAVSDQTRVRPQLDNVPDDILGRPGSKDEFQRTVAALNNLIDRVNINYRISRLWAYHMAHELKTPLSIMGLEIEKIQNQIEPGKLIPLTREGQRISETINSFLGWAELENSTQQKRLFANRLGATAQSTADRFSNSHPGRIVLEVRTNPIVMATPQHLEQMIANLLSNALFYSKGKVTLRISDETLTVDDDGPGIPREVRERLGEPFNRGTESNGHGLGLAWVTSICRLYEWKFGILGDQSGSRVGIKFQKLDEPVCS